MDDAGVKTMQKAATQGLESDRLTPDYSTMVLLVDDQAMVAQAVGRLLADLPDIDFHYCSEPTEAIKVANDIRPTVILQDLVMPTIDGLDLVRLFRANRGTAETPIIVLSSEDDSEVKSQAFAVGANDYLVKLPDKIELIARIRYHSQGVPQSNPARRCVSRSQGKPAAVASQQHGSDFPESDSGGSHTRQGGVRREHEPRNPDADEWCHRNDHSIIGNRTNRRTARLRRNHSQLGRLPGDDH
jgi:CheY-like chemotaxis protein